MAKKKDPLNADNPYQQPDTRQSNAGVGAPGPDKPKDLTPTNTTFNQQPKVIYSKDRGVPTGIILPNGKQYLGVSPDEVRFLARKYSAVPGTTEYEDPKKQALLNQAAQQSTIEQEQLLQQQNMSTVADVQPAINQTFANPTPLDQSIYQNIAGSQAVKGVAEDMMDRVNIVRIASGIARKFGGGASSEVVKGLIASNPELAGKLETYHSDYSNSGNYALIKQEVQDAKDDATLAISLVNDPANRDYAIEKYHKAIARLYKADAQLKYLFDKDPGIDKEALVLNRADIKNYLDNTFPSNNRILSGKLTMMDMREVQQ
jgi:hypothetical protein